MTYMEDESMSKFCGNCGTQLDDNAAFCTNCGVSLSSETKTEASVVSSAKNVLNVVKEKSLLVINKMKNDKNFLYTVIGVAAAVVLAIVLLCVFLGGGYKKAINNYIDATYYGNYKAAMKCMPDEYWEYMEDELNVDLDDLEDDFEESFENREENLKEEYGKRYKVTYKVTDKDVLDNDDLRDIKDELKKFGIKKKDVTKAMEVEIEYTIKGSEDKDTDDTTLTLVKIGNKWYVYD